MRGLFHLSADEMLALVEGDATGEAFPHLATCDRCRLEVAELRAALGAAAAIEVPEPSPLFWDHLSARVHAAVAAPPPARGRVDRSWASRWRRATVAAAAVVAVVAVVAVALAVWTPMDWWSRRAPDAAAITLSAPTGDEGWEANTAAELGLHAGVLDRALADLTSDLTADEQSEVRRVLTLEMTADGV